MRTVGLRDAAVNINTGRQLVVTQAGLSKGYNISNRNRSLQDSSDLKGAVDRSVASRCIVRASNCRQMSDSS